MKISFRGILISAFTFLFWFNVYAQEMYPQNYFSNPLNIPIQLAANFGELRSNHFHMGLDIRTQSKENLPVLAAAEGYISRIKIEEYGYGRAIYINHPNGYTTLYAHLNSFYPQLEQYLKDKQYKDESWEQDFELPADMFTVKKGQFIANSGNTGGSQGPHLHFEIRDTKTGNNLNPLLFGLPVTDKIPPQVYGLYWYDRRYSMYVAEPQIIPISKKGAAYNAAAAIVKVTSSVITLGIRMDDMNNASTFKFGVYHAALYMDDVLQVEFRLNNFSYPQSRYVNACMDFSKWVRARQGIQYLSVLPGNKLNVFLPLASDGKLLLNDTAVHTIRIELSDENNNTSNVNLLLQYVNKAGKEYTLPANAIVCDANEVNNVTTESASIYFNSNAFYNALPLTVYETASVAAKQVSPTIHIGNYAVPVHSDYAVSIRADSSLNTSLQNKVVLELKSGNSTTVVKGQWQDNRLIGYVDELGDARLLLDTTAPVITPVNWKNGSTFSMQKTLMIKCTDDISDIDTFTAKLDGKWLMFAKKGDYFTYSFDEHFPEGEHNLVIEVKDVAGNPTTKTFKVIKQ